MDSLAYGSAGAVAGDRTRTLFGQTMGCVAATAGFFALGAYLALSQFARFVAQETGPRGITVNVVTPGPVDETAITADVLGAEHKQRLAAQTRAGRGARRPARRIRLGHQKGPADRDDRARPGGAVPLDQRRYRAQVKAVDYFDTYQPCSHIFHRYFRLLAPS